MNTQSMPALARALSGTMPQQAVRQLMQALGNCNQDVNQRGGVNIQPTYRLQNGVASPGTWNPSQYQGLLPNAGEGDFIVDLPDIPTYTNSPWNSVFYGGTQFNFPTSQEFAVNNFYGGPSTTIGGNIEMDFVSVVRFQRRGGRDDDELDAMGRPAAQSANNVFNTFESNIPVPELEPPIVLDPIQYVTGVSVTLSKSRKGITLPKNFAAPLNAGDFETSDIPTDLSIDGSQNIAIPPIPDKASLESINITPTSCLSVATNYELSGTLQAPDTKPTGLTQEPNSSPITLAAADSVAVMRADAVVSGSATGTGSIDLGTINLDIPIGSKTFSIPLGSHKFTLSLPSGFDADNCSLTYSVSEFTIPLGNVSATVNFGDTSANFTLGNKDVNVSVPASGFTVSSAAGDASVPTSFDASIDLSKIGISTTEESSELSLDLVAVSPTKTVEFPLSFSASSGNVTLSGGNGTNITIDGSSFVIKSGGSQAVFSGVKPEAELSQPEMEEEFFVLEDAAVTTSVSTEFALTTPFGGQ